MKRRLYYSNELIKKRRKKRKIRKFVFIFILLVVVCSILCFKLPYFNIKHILIYNNKTITSKEIISKSGISEGQNIFLLSLSRSEKNISNIPYILSVRTNRKFPDSVEIYIKERKALYYVIADNQYLILDKYGVVLEKKSSLNDSKLIKLTGFDSKNAKIGEPMQNSTSKINALQSISNSFEVYNDSNMQVKELDLSNVININVYYGNMCVKLGDSSNIDNKINKAVKILEQSANGKDSKGYIDVSCNADPVIYLEK